MRNLLVAYAVKKGTDHLAHLCSLSSGFVVPLLDEPRCLRGFLPGSTQNGLYSHRRWLEA